MRYEAVTKNGRPFRNIETFTIQAGKICHVEVYFGSDTADSVRWERYGGLRARE